MTFGRTIRIYLPDGAPSGLRHAEITNWSGQAIACPRSRLSDLGDWDDARRPGVYFLLSNVSVEEKGRAYVGESENVYLRLVNQDKDKDFWSEVILFTSKDENLTKAHVKYLESRLIDLAQKARRYNLENSVSAALPAIPRGDRDAMEEFIENLRLLLATLGHRLLEPLSIKPKMEVTISQVAITNKNPVLEAILTYSFKNLVGSGQVTDEGFLVLAGSQATIECQDSAPDNIVAIREELIRTGILENKGDHLVLAQDHLFTSSSAAACFLSGNSRNGRDVWKDESGRSLKQLEEIGLKNR